MLHALPFATFGEAAALGLEAHVYCPSCYATRQLDTAGDRLRHRCFASTRFRCTNTRWDGEICGGPGSVTIQPTELLPVGGNVRPAFLLCERCLPPWYINHIPIDRPLYGPSSIGRSATASAARPAEARWAGTFTARRGGARCCRPRQATAQGRELK